MNSVELCTYIGMYDIHCACVHIYVHICVYPSVVGFCHSNSGLSCKEDRLRLISQKVVAELMDHCPQLRIQYTVHKPISLKLQVSSSIYKCKCYTKFLLVVIHISRDGLY